MVKMVKGDGVKTVLTAPWLTSEGSVLEGYGQQVRNAQDSFSKIPLVFRALRLRCNTLRRVPVRIFQGGKEVEQYPFEESLPLKDLIWLTEAALLLNGKSVSVALRNEYDVDVGLQWLNPFTVQVTEVVDSNGYFHKQFWQDIKGQRYPKGLPGYWLEDEIYYVREFSIMDDVGSGTAAAQVALGNAQLVHYVTQFLGQFFKSGAMPALIITVPEQTDTPEKERIENWFQKAAGGVAKAFKVLAVSKTVEINPLTPEIKSFDIQRLDAHAIEAVADAFDLPTSLLRAQAKTKAIADAERESFMNDTIWARCDMHQSRLNRFLAPYGFKVEFAVQETPEMQENEEERAQSLVQYVNAGFSLAAAAAILGIDVPKEFEDELKVNRQRKLADTRGRQQGVNDVELGKLPLAIQQLALARTRADDSGDSALSKQIADKIQELLSSVNVSSPQSESTFPPVKSNGYNYFHQDMERWQRKALNRLKEGKSPAVEFQSEHIAQDIQSGVLSLLGEAKNEQQVKSVFTDTAEHFGGNDMRSPIRISTPVNVAQPNINVEAPNITAHLHVPETLKAQVDITPIIQELAQLRKLVAENNTKAFERIAQLSSDFLDGIDDMSEAQKTSLISSVNGLREAVVTAIKNSVIKDNVAVNTETILGVVLKEAARGNLDVKNSVENVINNQFSVVVEKLEAVLEAINRPRTKIPVRDKKTGLILKIKEE